MSKAESRLTSELPTDADGIPRHNPFSITFEEFLAELSGQDARWRRRRAAVDTVRVGIDCGIDYIPLRD